MKIVGVKARLYLIDFKFLAKHAGCHFTLISDVTPSVSRMQKMGNEEISKGWNSKNDRNLYPL
jgi:hypothetical protein